MLLLLPVPCVCGGPSLITLIAAFANMGTPLNAVMLLWINLIMDTLGALAMSTEAPDPRVLEQPPRRKDEKVGQS